MVKKLLHLEGLVFLIIALVCYWQLQGNWLMFILLLFTPDVSMIGYLRDKKLGATIYNMVHNYIVPVILIAGGLSTGNSLITQLGVILFAHVALDRFLGFGLKYPADFKSTHLQKV